jgi:hypothetical protein
VSPPRPHPEAVLLGPEEPVPGGREAWTYEGTLERFSGGHGRFPFRQRVAWPAGAEWQAVRALGLWIEERLSINGHVLMGLRAYREQDGAEGARRIGPAEE